MAVLDDAADGTPAERFGLLPEELDLLSLTASARATLRIRRQRAASFVPTGALILIFCACVLSLFGDLA